MPLIYFLQASLVLALLYAVYWLFLRRTGFHQVNRFVLLGIALASLLLPAAASLLPDLTPVPHIVASGFVKYNPSPTVAATGGYAPTHISLVPIIIGGLYSLGLLIFLLRFLTPILTLIYLIRKNPTHREATYTLVQLEQPTPPFSFFRYVFLHEDNYPESQRRNILLHEQVHIKQLHTLDILLLELYTAVFWFNPFAWLLNRQTKLNLEYIADQQLLRKGVAPKEYQYHLLQLSIGPSLSRMANYFNQSHLQKRIAMINSTTRRSGIWKYGLFLPVLTALCLVFASGKAQAPENPSGMDIYVVIRPDLSESVIRVIETDLLKEGITLRLTDLRYTAAHELSGFRLSLAQNGQTLEDLTIAPTGQPLSEPVVFYWLRTRNGNPTLTRGIPGDLAKKDVKIMQNLSGLLKLDPRTKDLELHGAARIGD